MSKREDMMRKGVSGFLGIGWAAYFCCLICTHTSIIFVVVSAPNPLLAVHHGPWNLDEV
jgi:hypothetical protein